jgi:hypothetical protein
MKRDKKSSTRNRTTDRTPDANVSSNEAASNTFNYALESLNRESEVDNSDAAYDQLNEFALNGTALYAQKYNDIDRMLMDFRDIILEIQLNTSYFGQDCKKNTKWSFSSSLLFTITIISTIGYGFIAPLTWEGRVVSICYASMGIPIFLLCLANLSGAFGSVFKFLYTKFDQLNPISNYLNRRKRERKMRRRELKRATRRRMASSNTDNSSSFKDYKNVIVVHDGQSIVTKSEISSNVLSKELEEFTNVYDFHLTDEENQTDEYDSDDEDDDDDGDDQFNSFHDKNNREVPVSLAILIIAGYMMGGALLFQKFEGWSLSKSFYFVYVTLSTMVCDRFRHFFTPVFRNL